MITTFYPPYHFGGDGVFVYRLANALAQRGHQVEVVHCLDAYHSLQKQPQTHPYENHRNVVVHSLRSGVGILSPLLTQQLSRPLWKGGKIQRILAAGNFDVIHFHNISLLGATVLGYGDAIKLYTMHEYWLVCPMHVLFKYNREACVEPNCLSCTLSYKRPPQLWRYGNLLQEQLRHVDAFLAPSRFAMEMHRQRGLALPMVHMPLFVPESESTEIGVPDPADPYFLYVGRLEKLKGVQDLIVFFRDYSQAKLYIAGSGSHRQTLQELAAGATNISFIGSLSYAALSQLYRKAIAVLVPSLCYETFGLTVVEAFAHRIPVIARDIGALRELVVESGGGYLYQNSQQLAEYAKTLMTRPDIRDQLAERGHQAYRDHWTETKYIERYLQLIETIRESG